MIKKQLFASILSGLLLALSFPFIGDLAILSFVAFIPLLFIEDSIYRAKTKSINLLFLSYITFFIYNLGVTWWIWNASVGGAALAFIVNSLIMSLVFQLYHIAKKQLGVRLGSICFVVFWVAFEYLHFYWELSWPWLNLGNIFSNNTMLIQWYSITGVLGGSLWVVGVNMLLFNLLKAYVIDKHPIKSLYLKFTFFFSALLIPILFSFLIYYSFKGDQGIDTEVVITQPNIDPYNEKFTGDIPSQLDKITDLADSLVTDKTAFVIAPETALPFIFYEDEVERIIHYHYLVERKAQWKNAAFLIGASTKKFFKNKHSRASRKLVGGPGYEENYNSSMLINHFDQPSFTHKSKLVLGVEKIPYSDIFPFLEDLSINNGGASGTLGTEEYAQVMRSRNVKFAPVVCYESIYGAYVSEQCRKGAELIFILTNDGWWGNTPGYKQHMSFARLRAIENRKCVARSANTGYSCFINQLGDVVYQSKWWQPTSAKGILKRNKIKTTYMKWGDYIGFICVFISFLFLILIVKKRISLIYINRRV